MALLRLPPETLKFIFDLIGSAFFHEDPARLTISKHWFTFALPICYTHITLSQRKLRSLIASGIISRPAALKHSLETLDLELRGFEPRIATSIPPEPTQEPRPIGRLHEGPDGNSATTQITALNDDLTQLATVVQESPRLHTLRIRAWSYPSVELLESPEENLLLPVLQAFLSVENLRVLVLDICGNFMALSETQDMFCHICPAIGALLGTLKSLHVRMRSICPDVLRPRDPHGKLQLSEVVVNLSINTNIPEITSMAHSKRCGSPGRGLLHLKADMQEQAEALVAQMKSPKLVRILTHTLPQLETESMDILTGKIMTLDEGVAWDEDGKTVKVHSEPDSELSDNDSFTSEDEFAG